ncbi:putative transcription regulator TRAF family [Helianthus annuus]|uniref:Putative SKP1/BTB/POZ domain-containing protein n=1 Tax=Helianthus annuus TaxID=4232 RepID=A0A251TY12_HELAN|nr:BTB/POZ domain-containing protein At5g03250 [Helianthus annuus]KAF5791250.1 putative transcription regulator TRAF family [Helianthus annuus]KAJ0542749.1 putative chromatin remodeling & transcription regulator BTB-POZ family [Helianthus annuus]
MGENSDGGTSRVTPTLVVTRSGDVFGNILCTSGLPGDVTIEIGETSFHLHKFPLISRSGLLTRLIGDFSNEDEHVCIVHLDEIPGGSKYGIRLFKKNEGLLLAEK